MITTKRLTLRKPSIVDAFDVYALYADPRSEQLYRESPDPDLETSMKRLQRWMDDWENDGTGYFVVQNKGLTVGFAGVRSTNATEWNETNEPVLNLFYRFVPESQGHGFLGEAVRAVIDYAREQFRDMPIVAILLANDVASITLIKHFGFEFQRALTLDESSVEYRFAI